MEKHIILNGKNYRRVPGKGCDSCAFRFSDDQCLMADCVSFRVWRPDTRRIVTFVRTLTREQQVQLSINLENFQEMVTNGGEYPTRCTINFGVSDRFIRFACPWCSYDVFTKDAVSKDLF